MAPVRAFARRFAFGLLLLASVGLMFLGRVDTETARQLQAGALDGVAPVLDAFSRPAATVANLVEEGQAFLNVYQENRQLKAENQRLEQWVAAARQLEAENERLRELLNYSGPSEGAFVSARVVADSGGTYARSLLISAGGGDGVKRGQAAVVGNTLVGRVVQVGQRSARILLVTDLNSRVPVVVGAGRSHAVMAGNNSPRPELAYLPAEASIEAGDSVVTSGRGGVFPPGLPVGRVVAAENGKLRVAPAMQERDITHVRLIDSGLESSLVPARDGQRVAPPPVPEVVEGVGG